MRFFVIAVLSSSLAEAQKCATNLDCRSIEAPHCSKFGWCQWTPRYGDGGPSQAEASKRSFSIQEMADEEIENLYKITDYAGEYMGSEIYDYYNYDILKKEPKLKDSDQLDSSIFGGDVQLVTLQPPTRQLQPTRQLPTVRQLLPKTTTPDPTIGKAFHSEPEVHEQLPEQGETKGCLYDCVSDCVPIKRLEAYTQCVTFCGNRCQ